MTNHIPLESESIDFCLMATILHDLSSEEQDSTLKEVTRVLKPAGILSLIEFKKIDRGPGPPTDIRISEDDAEKIMKKYGFVKTFLGDIGEYNYMLNLRKTK